MSKFTAELTSQQIDDWFKGGSKVKVETLSRTRLGGRHLNPQTGGPAQPQVIQQYVPSYRRNVRRNNPQQTEYAEEYKRREAREQLNMDDAVTVTDIDVYSGVQSVVGESLIEKVDDSTMSQVTSGDRGIRLVGGQCIELPKGMTEAEACGVYRTYDFSQRADNHLSIAAYRQDIIDMIESNQVTIIQGETGSGKTTQVAQYILDEYAANQRYCNIVVTQPRRIAAVSIAKRVCSERNWQIGGICGYQIGMDRVASDDTRLLYCTTGVLLQKLVVAKNLHQFTHIILDEVHERDEDTDFCMLVVKKFLNTNSKDTKVVLMSATFDTQMFGQYYARLVADRLETSPVITVEGRSYHVDEYYLDDLSALGKPSTDYYNSGPALPRELLEIAVQLLLKFDGIEAPTAAAAAATITGGRGNESRGSVLIFLPGIGEIEELDNLLRRDDLAKKHKFHVKALHSTITADEQIQVFKPAPVGFRKIILSTNIAESSITIPDIRYVIDFCLTKTNVCDPNTNYTSLQLQWASKANCTQRKGRAGRVANGRCYRLVTNKHYNTELEEYGQPEMQRCRLDQLILHVKKLDIGEPKAVLALALSPPNLDDIERTILALIEVGALRSIKAGRINPHDGELTFVGQVLACLPVDLQVGKLMLLAHVFGFLEEAVIVAASTALKSFFAQPFKSSLKSYSQKLMWAGDSFSDCIAYVNAFKEWRFQRDIGRFYNTSDESRWCTENWIQMRRIHDVEELISDLTKRLRTFNICAPEGPLYKPPDLKHPETQLIFKLVLAGAFYPNYFVQSAVDQEVATKELSGYNPCTTVMVRGLPLDEGPLYKSELEKMFAWCDEGRKPRVQFESSRAYIEFTRNLSDRSCPNRILPAVYRAIKMKHIQQGRNALTVNYIMPPTATDDRLTATVTSTASSSTAATSAAAAALGSYVPSARQLAPRQVGLPGPVDKVINIQATQVIECGHFWATYLYKLGHPISVRIRQQQERINASVNRQRPGSLRFNVDDYCLAPYDDPSGSAYYRAKILKIFTHQMAEVFFLDYGNKSTLPIKRLHAMDAELFELPFQAFECQLSGIKPSVIKCPAGEWTEEATAEFSRVISCASKLYAEVYSIVHGVVRIQLVVLMADGREFCVNDALVKSHYADVSSEPYLSQMSCIERDRLSTVDAFCSGRSVFDEFSDVEDTSKDLPTMVMNQLSLAPSGEQGLGAGKNRQPQMHSGQPINLRGPYSPYEVDYTSCTYIGKNWPTRIERDSVNSVSLNAESSSCGSSSSRMMVAAAVALNQSQSTITARDTTLLPAIPGLLSLVSLIFTPVAELRVDSRRTKYTGALCGLGWNDEEILGLYGDAQVGGRSGGVYYAALPENDIELLFDVCIDDEDVKLVNSIRIAINLGIGSTDSVATWTQDTVVKLQNKARDTLLRLLRKRRETLEPTMFNRPYHWCQMPREYIHTAQLDDLGTDMMLYSLHSLCELVHDDTGSVITSQTPRTGPAATRIDYNNADVTDRVAYQVYLEQIAATMSMEQKEIVCRLCQLKVNSARELSVHLKSVTHLRKKPLL